MERKLTAELWDKMHYLFRDFNDRMVHVELNYDFVLDVEALKTVIICAFEKVPVLHSKFVDKKLSTYWKVMPYNIEDVLTVEYPDDMSSAVENFLTQYIPPESHIQMKFALFIKDGKSTLCMIENHMCMDGGDLKYFLQSFCQNYTKYVENGVSPIEYRTGSRAYTDVYSGFSQMESGVAQRLFKNINARDNHKFPLTKNNIRDASFIARKKFNEEILAKLKAKGKEMGATVNEMLLAAYFYSVYELANFPASDQVMISSAIDLRRHMDTVEDKGFTNHTAWMQCAIPERGRDIFETVQYVVRSSNRFKKDKFMGLYGLPLLNFGYSILPHAASEEIIKIGYSNPYMAMSNIGIIKGETLSLCGNEPADAFMSGAVKYKPFVLLTATTYKNVITLSMCVRGNDKDKEIVEQFFDLMEKNIKTLTNE
ncbi:MAG: hypothetical protein J6B37_00525 [Clostridia bacterium]|nr:hypothetical protein [Clostridia bacterium]